MDFYTRAAASATAVILEDKSIGKIANVATDALFFGQILTVLAPLGLEEQKANLMHLLEASRATDRAFETAYGALEMIEEISQETPVKAEAHVESPEQKILRPEAAELTAAAEPEKPAGQERVAEPVQAISEEAQNAKEIDALKKDFKQEQLDLTGKLDAIRDKYFDKYPNLSEDQREDAAKTFGGVKAQALADLQDHQEARMMELTINHEMQSVEPEKPREWDEK